MEAAIIALGTVIASLVASGGFWAYLQKKDSKKEIRDTRQEAMLTLLLGLAHDRIIYLGMGYIEQGMISKDELEDLNKYLYKPYSEFGGNGLADRVMRDVDKLPLKTGRIVVRRKLDDNPRRTKKVQSDTEQ